MFETYKDFKEGLKGKSKNTIVKFAWKLYQDNIRFSNKFIEQNKKKIEEIKKREEELMNSSPNEVKNKTRKK